MSQHFEADQWVAAPVAEVFAFFADPHNLPRIMPPKQGAALVKLTLVPPRFTEGAVPPGAERMAGVGSEIVVKFLALPPIPMHERWTAQITEFSLNEYFRDVQTQGPFRNWEHTHRFRAEEVGGRHGTRILDSLDYGVGFGFIGSLIERLFFQRLLRRTFDYRKQAIERIFAASTPGSQQ